MLLFFLSLIGESCSLKSCFVGEYITRGHQNNDMNQRSFLKGPLFSSESENESDLINKIVQIGASVSALKLAMLWIEQEGHHLP